MSVQILHGDVLDKLRELPDESVQCVVTSPPYWGLRDYGAQGQIGLEPTSAEWVAKMVEVFREVRRVLRPDGTLWLNLGDSYAGSWGAQSRERAGKHAPNASALSANQIKAAQILESGTGSLSRTPGLKPKDLIGQPWRVAFALQQPYYTGRIKSEMDRVWLAAMIDAEGCLFIHKRKAGQSNGQGYVRKNDSFSPGLEVANTSLAIVERCLKITGLGSICSQGPEQNGRRRQTIYRWNLRTTECRDIVREVYPYLVAKQQQARILCGCPSSGADAEAAHAALIGLHRGSASDIDFKAPASMYEPGWYLRQDVIWSKANPMPESVRDRCTKAHEYIFLLSKSKRYFYDADAISEPTSDGTHPRVPGNKSHKGAEAYAAGDEMHRTKAALVAYSERQRAKFPSGWAHGDQPHDSAALQLPGVHRKDRTAHAGRPIQSGLASQVSHRPNGKRNGSFDEAMEVMPGRRNRRDVWTIASEPYQEAHFATFPSELPRLCILAASRVGDTVLDPFAGSGTTLAVALELGRKAVGIELNGEYVALIERRLSRTTLGLPLEAVA